jgi:hypothetical protein
MRAGHLRWELDRRPTTAVRGLAAIATDCKRLSAALTVLAALALATSAHAATAPLSQGFEDGAPAWTATGMWHVQPDPQAIRVSPDIAGRLVTLPDAGFLPAASGGTSAAWFGEPATGTYCGSDYATVRQTPQNGCESAAPQSGTLTSPTFSLAGRSEAFLAFDAWWEIEAINADIADLMQAEYSTDGGATWWLAQTLNPLQPAWGGGHQQYSDAGVRTPGVWERHVVDLSAAAGSPQVQVRFTFNTVDSSRNGFRGLLIDGVALVDGIGAVIQDPGSGSFTDDPPAISIGAVDTQPGTDGSWDVGFEVQLSHPSPHPVTVDWTLDGNSGDPITGGTVTIPAGELSVPVSVHVPGDDPPATVTLGDPSGGTIAPGSAMVSVSSPTPALTLAPVVVKDAGSGTAELTLTAQLSAPTTLPVSVAYTVTGAGGSVLATGSIEIAPGTTSATVSVLVPADQLPVAIDLANPSNATLDPAAAHTTSPDLAVPGGPGGGGGGGGAGSPTPTGSPSGTPVETPGQLVLGAREAGPGLGPELGKTFELTYLSGRLRYHLPGKAYRALARGSLILPMGSVVDARNGHARVTVESDAKGTRQSGEFYDGAFGVFQRPGPAPVADIVLAGGEFPACPGTSRKKKARRPRARHSRGARGVRRLWSSAKGSFRTKGRFASATVRGTKWLTEDRCLATRISVEEGVVNVYDFRRKRTMPVRAGESITVGALQSARYRNRTGRNRARLSRER